MLDGGQDTAASPVAGKVQKKHIKSSISFPYANLEEVAAIAKAIYARGGMAMTRDQIANLVNSSPDSSTFNVKLASGKTFGIFTSAPEGRVVLTETGTAIAGDGDEEKAARVTAFLNVELYQKLVEHFQGKKLPPTKGLEAAIIAMGVSERQGDKARQAFDRSASYAGFFNATKDRLVEPIVAPAGQHSPLKEQATAEQQNQFVEPPAIASAAQFGSARVSQATVTAFDPLIEGMLKRLPEAGTEWPMQRRVQWLRTFAANLSEVYQSDVNGEIVVKFEREPD